MKISIRVTRTFPAVLLWAGLSMAAPESAAGLYPLSGVWYARAGFEREWLTDTLTDGWTPVELPGFLIPEGRNLTGPFMTVKRIMPGTCMTGCDILFRGFDCSYPAVYYVNGISLDTTGSVDPYVHAHDQRPTVKIPENALTCGDGNILGFVLYRAPGFRDKETVLGSDAYLGTGTAVNRIVFHRVTAAVILLTVFAVVGLYHLLLGIVHPKDRYNLLFGAFCLVFTVFTLANTELTYMVLPTDSYLAPMTDRISVKLLGPLFYFFISYLFEGRAWRTGWWWSGFCGVLLLIDIVAPVNFSFLPAPRSLTTLQVWMVGFAVFVPVMFYHTWRHIRNGNRDAKIIGIGLALFIGATGHDLLRVLGVFTEGGQWAPTAFSLFLLGIAAALAVRYAGSRKQLERMNTVLEDKVADRTRSLNDALAAYKRSNRELTEFAHIASHDLKEPLRKVMTFGERIKANAEKLDDRSRDYLDRIQNAVERMTGLLDGLLEYARVTTKGQPFTETDLPRITREVLSDLEVRVQETGARVEVGDLPVIQADPLQMRQLLQNLIGNALKYHRPGVAPEIRVAGRREEGRTVITVEDNGIGIAPGDREKAFGVFRRLVGKNEYEGTGVGLSICKKIAERHGGTIAVHDGKEGGSVFVTVLPVRKEAV